MKICNKIRPQGCPLPDEPTSQKIQQHDQNHVQLDIFHHLNVHFKINEVHINEDEFLHTIFVPTHFKQVKHRVFYLTHGFGGSSLMYFPIVKFLLQYGNVVLWEIRGMGMSKKLDQYNVGLQETQSFFVQPIELMLKFYSNYDEIFFVSHSFGGYLTLLYILKYKTFNNNIKQVILFSPVGITPKEFDYKSKVRNLSDCLHVIGNKISWKFHLTYKSPFRCLCICFKNSVFTNAVKDCGFDSKEEILMKDLLISMIEGSDGSQNVFFNYFQPRVLPKFPLEPLFNSQIDVKIKIFYGGEQDWVDKSGAQRLRDKYFDKIDLKIVKQSGHNFPFFPQLIKKNLRQVLDPYNHNLQLIIDQKQVKYFKQIHHNRQGVTQSQKNIK